MSRATATVETRPTRVGWIFLAVIFAILVPAYALNVSQIFLLNAFFMAMFAINWVRAILVSKNVNLVLAPSEELFANTDGVIGVQVVNRSRRSMGMSELSLELPECEVESQWLDKVAGKNTLLVNLVCRPRHRGHFTAKSLKLETSYPFGLVRKTIVATLDEQVAVFPELLPNVSPHRADHIEQGKRPHRSDDYQYLATYNPGDDVRLIHWKKSTLLETPVLKKDLINIQQTQPRLFVPDPCPHFEYAVSVVATYADQDDLQGWLLWDGRAAVPVDQRLDLLHALIDLQPVEDALLELGDYNPLYASELKPPKENS